MKKAKEKTTKIDFAKEAKEVASELLSLMGVNSEIEAAFDKEAQTILININSNDETGLLIGRHGETLLSIQTVLGMILQRRFGDWKRVNVNIGDWKERQEEKLKEMATQTAERVKATGEAQPLYNLTPAQRRVIHLVLSEDPDVETESQGEEENRFLLVKPRAK